MDGAILTIWSPLQSVVFFFSPLAMASPGSQNNTLPRVCLSVSGEQAAQKPPTLRHRPAQPACRAGHGLRSRQASGVRGSSAQCPDESGVLEGWGSSPISLQPTQTQATTLSHRGPLQTKKGFSLVLEGSLQFSNVMTKWRKKGWLWNQCLDRARQREFLVDGPGLANVSWRQ